MTSAKTSAIDQTSQPAQPGHPPGWSVPETFPCLKPLSEQEQSLALKTALTHLGHAAWLEDAFKGLGSGMTLACLRERIATAVLNATFEQQEAILKTQMATPLPAALAQSAERYVQQFGWPHLVALAGPRRAGMTHETLASQLERRLAHPVDHERRVSVQEVLRTLEIAFDPLLNTEPVVGDRLWDWHEDLTRHSDQEGALTVTFMTAAHQQVALDLADRMSQCGCDEVHIDDLGNVVGVYHGQDPEAPRLLTGSHYDTVRNGGRYDGRLGILLPLACIDVMHQQGIRPARGIEVIGFSEEEGQRFAATFLASGAVTGKFNYDWLDQTDANGISMREAIEAAGHNIEGIASIKRDPARYRGFVEVHIEQGPVLNNKGLSLGVVTSINGGVRFKGQIKGLAGHAGTTPMIQRQDAACAAARIILLAQQCALAHPGSVATVGMLQVPNGSINVIPGLCEFSLDVRAPTDAQRDTVIAAIVKGIREIEASESVCVILNETMRVAAAPSDPAMQQHWDNAVRSLGLQPFELPSGAGHDAMKLATVMPQAMLFVRGENNGISHNPLESTTSHDMELATAAMLHLIQSV
ncbi:hydantoinase/carbamoylase family amidase [Orrella marina]|uniref:Allantoate amidohydrolase n=1 Tax=Orrella marina TaxID=2163011 RepID=A0A2R4XH43_9BURK|nr:hydantoinase/carbamoylase family amidase [Orrella marina]AWB33126.1 allantoate amidohydrolase [Orrella marina]